MSKKDDGGLAFPFFDERMMNSPEWGMTLSDYFAAKHIGGRAVIPGECDAAYEARLAYEIADAMLKERTK